jgi:hypothetical protein
MNDLRSRGDVDVSDGLDGALRSFFRAEMPDPWPVMSAPELPPQAAVVRPWWKRGGRFALAASIALMLVGYLALARGFPRSEGVRPDVLDRVIPPIGDKPSLHPRRPVGTNLIRMPVLIEESKGRDGWSFKIYTETPKEKR